jgi:hypothetical protein
MTDGSVDLAYYRLSDLKNSISQGDVILSVCMKKDKIALGTRHGWVYIANIVSGQIIAAVRAHNGPIADLSMDPDATCIGSCGIAGDCSITRRQSQHSHGDGGTYGYDSDNGMRLNESELVEFKSASLHIKSDEPASAIAVEIDEDGTVFSIIGLRSGVLLKHTSFWYKSNDKVLFTGTNAPIVCISPRKDLVAWADTDQVRVMDIARMQPLCYVSNQSLTRSTPTTCRLTWDNDSEILVVSSTGIKHLIIDKERDGSVTKFDYIITEEINVLAIVPTDKEHLIILTEGLQPGIESLQSPYSNRNNSSDARMKNTNHHKNSTHGMIDAIVMERSTGIVKRVDTLPRSTAKGAILDVSVSANYGADYPYAVLSTGDDLLVIQGLSMDIKISTYIRKDMYMAAARTAILSEREREREKDKERETTARAVGSQINSSMGQEYHNQTKKLEFSSWDVISLHITRLLDDNKGCEAAVSLVELLGTDSLAWAHWIMVFRERGQLPHLAPLIPTYNPRLDSATYELVLSFFLESKQTYQMVQCLRRWLSSRAFVIDFAAIIELIDITLDEYNISTSSTSTSTSTTTTTTTNKQYISEDILEDVIPKSSFGQLLECKALLLYTEERYEESLQLYLDIGK